MPAWRFDGFAGALARDRRDGSARSGLHVQPPPLRVCADKPRRGQSGITLIELVVVVTITAILAYVALVSLGSSSANIQTRSAVQRLLWDIRYAQQLAMASGTGTQVHVSVNDNQYYLTWSDGSYLDRPVAGGSFIVKFGKEELSGVKLTSTGLSAGRLDFDTFGIPYNSGSTFSGKLTVAAFANGMKVTVAANTGFVALE